MTTYYIKASGGSDANPGTTTAGAFATISKGCIAAVAGDTVVCLTGTYNAAVYINKSNMKNGTIVSPITFKSVTPYAAQLAALAAPAAGGTNDAMLECRCDGWVIDGFLADSIKGYSGGPGTWSWVLGGAGQYREGIMYTGLNGVIQNCLVRNICLADPGGSGGAGIQIEGFYISPAYGNTNSTIRYNIIHDTASSQSTNKSHGIYVTCAGSTCQGNLIYNMFNGCQLHGWHGFTGPANWSNNTIFHGTNTGILFGQGDAGASGGVSNLKIFNNIVQDIAGGTGIGLYRPSTSPAIGPGITVSHNMTGGNGTAYVLSTTIDSSGLKYTTPAGFVNYVLTGGGDYHLAAGAPAEGKGLPSLSTQPAPTLDIDGVARPQGTTWDLGAYELVVAGDTTPPTFATAVVQNTTPTVLTITMSETLGATVPPSSAFNVGKTITNVQVSGATVILTVSVAYVSTDNITVTYTKPGASPWIVDVAGNAAASFGPSPVTNNVQPSGDVNPPTFVSAAVQDATPNRLTITMSETLGATVPPASAFNVSRAISSVQVSGSTVILTVSTPYVSSDIITVQYTKPAASPWIADLAGNAASSFGPFSVTNNVGSGSNVTPDPNPTSDFGGQERKLVFRFR